LGEFQVSGVAEIKTMETSAKALADEYRRLGGRRMAVIDDNLGSSRDWDGDQPEAAKFWREHIAILPADDRRDVETYLPSINEESNESAPE
jgi:hypothetical protein